MTAKAACLGFSLNPADRQRFKARMRTAGYNKGKHMIARRYLERSGVRRVVKWLQIISNQPNPSCEYHILVRSYASSRRKTYQTSLTSRIMHNSRVFFHTQCARHGHRVRTSTPAVCTAQIDSTFCSAMIRVVRVLCTSHVQDHWHVFAPGR